MRTLALKYLEEAHTGENIHQVLHGIFVEWRIETKVTHIVSDGAANMKNALSKFSNCAAHRLNLCVFDIFKEKKCDERDKNLVKQTNM
jgi:hypothetical protein